MDLVYNSGPAGPSAPLSPMSFLLSRAFRLWKTGLLLAGCAAIVGTARADDAAEVDRMFAAGQQAQAMTRLDQLLEQRPRDPQLRFLKGVLLSQSQRTDEAEAVFTELTVDYPELPEPHNNLAVIHAERGELDKARASLETALRAQPGYAAAHENLGDVYTQLARRAYGQALQLDPSRQRIPSKLALLRELVTPVASETDAPRR